MPRSPSRDRSDRFAGRRGYFRRLDTVGRLKVLLAAVAAIFATGWIAADTLWPRETQAAHTHGELADPHANLSDSCEKCHRPFAGGDASPFAAASRWRNYDCTNCHTGAPHHAETAADTAAHNDCGSCHRDHQGRLNPLTRVADSTCVGCHRDLSKHPTEAKWYHPPIENAITGFSAHPDFRGLTEPPEKRTLKFSHALHMTPGLYRGGEDGAAMTVDGGKRQLACGDCHQPDAGGKHYKPVSYEAHCQTCHPLTAPTWVTADKVVVKGFEVPHRTPLADGKAVGLKSMLTASYLRQMVAENPDKFAGADTATPGGRTDPERLKKAEGIRAEVARVVGTAAELLFDAGCAKCHDATPQREVVKVPDRAVWLPKARFDHIPHLRWDCQTCHPGTAGAVVPRPELFEKEVVAKNILGVGKCRECHTDRVPGNGETGVKHACTDCHSYHHPPKP